MTKKLTITLHEPDEDTMAELAIKAKRTYLFRAEQAFHEAWGDAEKWIMKKEAGTREIKAEILIATIVYEPIEEDAA